jgi:riboflavin biosynthesis pyrimidine reductase
LTLARLYPTVEFFDGLTSDEQSWVIAKEYGICNGWRVNFAIDSRGKSFGETGSSSDVSTDLDRQLLGKLRALSDVIVTSGKTARAEKYRSSKHAPIAIFTSSGDLDAVPAIQGTQYFTPIVLTPRSRKESVEEALSDVDVRVLTFEGHNRSLLWPAAIEEIIRHEGYQSPILESGQSTLREFIACGIVSEICLSITNSVASSVSARDLSSINLETVFGSIEGFSLRNLFTDGRTTFSRWVRHGVAAPQHPA